MITLYTFGPAFGLPDPSPFVTKAEMLLKMANLPYRSDTSGFRKAPKGKLPYIDDEGERIADSTLIRWHIEQKYGVDFDQPLTPEERAIAWAFEKMAEEHLYWTLVDARWFQDANFRKGPAAFFAGVPAPIRPLVTTMVLRSLRRSFRGQGMGRHPRSDIERLGKRSIDATAEFLADKPFFIGAEPTGVDATMFPFAAGALCPVFDTPLRAAAERHDNLRRYVGRMAARFYPDFGDIAGCKTAA
jgi:glutathione S-transferase